MEKEYNRSPQEVLEELGSCPTGLTEEQAAAQLAAWGLRPLRWEKSWRCRHIFTHVRWEMQGYAVTVAGEGELEWYPKERRQEMAVPSAFERANRILRELEGDQNGTALL